MKSTLIILNLLFAAQFSFGQTEQAGEIPPVITDFARNLESRVIETLSFSQQLGDYRDEMVAFMRNAMKGKSAYFGPMVELSDGELADFLLGRNDFQLVCLSYLMSNFIFFDLDDKSKLPSSCQLIELLNDEYYPKDQASLDAAMKAIGEMDPAVAQELLDSQYSTTKLYLANKEAIADFTKIWIEPIDYKKIKGINTPVFSHSYSLLRCGGDARGGSAASVLCEHARHLN